MNETDFFTNMMSFNFIWQFYDEIELLNYSIPKGSAATRNARWNIKKFHENIEIFQDPFLKYFMKLLIFNIKWLKTF